MTPAAKAQRAVRAKLAGRRLIWAGIRGEDGEALRQLPELHASFATIAPLRSGTMAPELNVTLESLTGRRPDLDDPNLDLDGTKEADEFRRRFLRAVSGRCVVMTYRPTSLIAAFAFSMADTMTLAGMFRDRQQAFENKPWVETRLAAEGVRGLDWRYVADEHRSQVLRWVEDRPYVLRASRASGGVGIALARTPEEVEANWPAEPDRFVAVAPYLSDATPVNFSGCVWADGTVRLHPVSVQLIGISGCTDRPFGYCGNDFAAAATLDPRELEEIDTLGKTVGRWLHREGYLGVFGLDALVSQGDVRFTEINARFQGSSAVSAEIAASMDLPDLFLDHLAATLGADPQSTSPTVTDWVHAQPPIAQVVVHNTGTTPLSRLRDTSLPGHDDGVRLAQLAQGVAVDPGATLCRTTLPRRVTDSGFELDTETQHIVTRIQHAFGGKDVR